MTDKFVEYKKLSKKQKKEYNNQKRVPGGIPTTKTFKSGKEYKRVKKVEVDE